MQDLRYIPISSLEIEGKGPDNEYRPFFIRFLKSYKQLLYEYRIVLGELDEKNYKEEYVRRLEEKNKQLNKDIDICRLKIAASSTLLKKANYKEETVNNILKHTSKEILIRYVRWIRRN